MIFKLVNYTVMGIALFYAAEGTGLIERGRYFPTLPRLDATASDPMAWLGAVQWGVTAVASAATGTGNSGGYNGNSSSPVSLSAVNAFTERLADARQHLTASY
jgi:hypothetical protein